MNSHPLVSIIIPTRNSATFLATCLSSIKNQTYKNIEIIVVDNNSTDNTKEIALSACPSKSYSTRRSEVIARSEATWQSRIFIFNKGPERSAQRNYGAKKSNGEYLLFIDSDMELTPKVIEECVKKIVSINYVSALVIPEKSVGIGFWTQCKALERSFYVGVDWIEAARFFKKSVFNQLKGYDEKNTGTEDYDLPQRLIKEEGEKSINRIYDFIIHNEGNLSLIKTFSKKMYYGKNLYRYTKTNAVHFSKQSSIFARYKLFFSQPKKLLRNPFVGMGMIFMKSCEFGFGGVGYLLNLLKIV